jgi:hypothetical protein
MVWIRVPWLYISLTPTVVQLEKKSCITADDDLLRCEIYFSWCARQISKYGGSNKPSEAYEATSFIVAYIYCYLAFILIALTDEWAILTWIPKQAETIPYSGAWGIAVDPPSRFQLLLPNTVEICQKCNRGCHEYSIPVLGPTRDDVHVAILSKNRQ